MAVRHALGYIQVGGAGRRRSQAHPRKSERAEPSAANGAECRRLTSWRTLPLNRSAAYDVFLSPSPIAFRKLRYDFRSDLPHIFAVHPTSEIIRKDEFSVFKSIRAYDIIVNDVRHEVLIQTSGVDEFFSRLLYVFCQIFYRMRQVVGLHRLKVIASEFLSENVILQSDPHLLCSRIIIAHLDIIARQRAFGDMKDTVKM